MNFQLTTNENNPELIKELEEQKKIIEDKEKENFLRKTSSQFSGQPKSSKSRQIEVPKIELDKTNKIESVTSNLKFTNQPRIKPQIDDSEIEVHTLSNLPELDLSETNDELSKKIIVRKFNNLLYNSCVEKSKQLGI